MDKHNPDWITGGPWYNTSICKQLHRKVFEVFIRNARTKKYNLMSSIGAHEKNYPSVHDDGSSGGGSPIPSHSTAAALVPLSTAINFNGCWLQALKNKFQNQKNSFQF